MMILFFKLLFIVTLALRDVFNSNGDGKFDASDAKWAQFKVMVTNADGSRTVTMADKNSSQKMPYVEEIWMTANDDNLAKRNAA